MSVTDVYSMKITKISEKQQKCCPFFFFLVFDLRCFASTSVTENLSSDNTNIDCSRQGQAWAMIYIGPLQRS